MGMLGNGLLEDDPAAAANVMEAHLATMKRWGTNEKEIITVQSNLAGCYRNLGRFDLALKMQRDNYIRHKNAFGERDVDTFGQSSNLARLLVELGQYDEGVTLAREQYHAARRVFGPNHQVSLHLARTYALALGKRATPADLLEAESVLVDALPRCRRVLGTGHPHTQHAQDLLDELKRKQVVAP